MSSNLQAADRMSWWMIENKLACRSRLSCQKRSECASNWSAPQTDVPASHQNGITQYSSASAILDYTSSCRKCIPVPSLDTHRLAIRLLLQSIGDKSDNTIFTHQSVM